MVLLLDTGFILALRNQNDENHKQAMKITEQNVLKGLYGKIVVTDYIYDELMTLISARIKQKKFMEKTSDFLLKSKMITFIKIPEEIFWNTILKFKQYFDQGLSFTDCTFLSLEENFKTKCYAATFDKSLAKFTTNIVN
ncbi:MAG: type II toxin-antitoxin system VapC family toxin [Candidatus Hodarchaeales archaeon]|jgi:predicted nucleic acid-binding protein